MKNLEAFETPSGFANFRTLSQSHWRGRKFGKINRCTELKLWKKKINRLLENFCSRTWLFIFPILKGTKDLVSLFEYYATYVVKMYYKCPVGVLSKLFFFLVSNTIISNIHSFVSIAFTNYGTS